MIRVRPREFAAGVGLGALDELDPVAVRKVYK